MPFAQKGSADDGSARGVPGAELKGDWENESQQQKQLFFSGAQLFDQHRDFVQARFHFGLRFSQFFGRCAFIDRILEGRHGNAKHFQHASRFIGGHGSSLMLKNAKFKGQIDK